MTSRPAPISGSNGSAPGARTSQPNAYHALALCARCGHDHASSPCPHWTTTGKARP